ncbi:MAG: glycosyltransferase family 9 protein [Deltaproteobacteria bacterium]|nr:glycosyltransferase family 9 protein [Deltaproteobacteria bacterium]
MKSRPEGLIANRLDFFARTLLLSVASALQAKAHAFHERLFPASLDERADNIGLLVIQLGQIGDYVLTESFLKAVKDRYGDKVRLTVLLDSINAGLCIKSGCADEVIIYNSKKYTRSEPTGFPAQVLEIGKYSAAVWLRGDLKTLFLLMRKRIPFVSAAKYPMPARRAWISIMSGRPVAGDYMHFCECLQNLFAQLFSENMMAAVSSARSSRHCGQGREVYIHIGAGNMLRRWPTQRFAKLCGMLLDSDKDLKISLLGSKADFWEAFAVMEEGVLSNRGERIKNLCGLVGLSELKELLSEGSLYIGFDSGPMHIAASSGIPIVAMMGPQSPKVFRPWGNQDTRIVYKNFFCSPCWQFSCLYNHGDGAGACVLAITPEEVFSEAEVLLRKSGNYEN